MEHIEKKIDQLKVIVFDLDYTLWPFWVDTHVDPPFKLQGGIVYDRRRQIVKHYEEVPAVLEKLKSLGYVLAIASRTGAIEEAEELLRCFNWNQYFSYKEIYPGTKTQHLSAIIRKSSCQPYQLMFFDDEYRNVRDVGAMQVCSILVDNGVSFKVVHQGLQAYLQANSQ